MINNWFVWSLWLDDWFMKSQSISPLRKWLSSLVVLSWVWKVYGVFSFEIRFWQHFKRYSNCNNNNACTQTVLKGAKKLSFTVWPIWAGCSLQLLAQESQLLLLCFNHQFLQLNTQKTSLTPQARWKVESTSPIPYIN